MANGKVLPGQLLFGPQRAPVQFTQQMVDEATVATKLGQENTEVTPNDAQSWEVREYDVTAAQAVLDEIFVKVEAYMDIQGVPPVLKDLTIVYEKGGGGSNANESGSIDVTVPYGAGASSSAQAEASAYCIPKATFKLEQFNGQNRKVEICYFYMETVTESAALARLTAELGAAVLAWPSFNPDSVTLVLKGERAQATARGGYSFSISDNGGGGGSVVITETDGDGFQVSPAIDPFQTPFAIHGSFNLASVAGDSRAFAANASYSISGGPLSGSGSPSATATGHGTVQPTSIAATAGNTAYPTTGRYLYKLTPQLEDAYGRFPVEAIVFSWG